MDGAWLTGILCVSSDGGITILLRIDEFVCQIRLGLLDKGRIGTAGLIKRNHGYEHVWKIHHSDDCHSGDRRYVAQIGDSRWADTSKTASNPIGTAGRQYWTQADQI